MQSGSRSNHGNTSRRRGRVACQKCRELKIRCGVEEAPCPRCEKSGLACVVDPNYRRIGKQGKMRELESHINQLESLVRSQTGTTAGPLSATQSSVRTATGDSIGSEREQADRENRNASDSFAGQNNTLSGNSSDLVIEPAQNGVFGPKRSLGHVILDHVQIQSLFVIFFEKYHHFLPFLEPSRTSEEYYESSNLLFWCIIAVAARQYRADHDLLTKIAPILSDLVWTVIASNPMALAHIQALLLISCWPLPNVRLWTDNSFILNNIALTSSMHLGLHRPGFEEEYTKNKIIPSEVMMQERTRTWIACVVLSQSLSVDFGLSSVVNFTDWTIHHACEEGSSLAIPPELRQNLLIQNCSHRAFLRLSQNMDHPFGLPTDSEFYSVMHQIENEFDLLQHRLGTDLSLINLLRFYTTRLHFQCVYFLDDTLTGARLAGISRAYSTASCLITSVISHPKSHELLSCAPLATFRGLMCSASVIFRVLHSSYGTEFDRGNGMILFNAAAFSMNQLSVQRDEKDMPIRAAGMLNTMWRHGANDIKLKNQPPTLSVKSRMGSSVIYDCLIIVRRYTSQESANAATSTAAAQAEGTAVSNLGSINPNIPTTSDYYMPDQMHGDLESGTSNLNQSWWLSDTAWIESFGYPSLFSLQ